MRGFYRILLVVCILIMVALVVILVVRIQQTTRENGFTYSESPGPIYETNFDASSTDLNSSCYNASGRQTNPFTASNPCLKCANSGMDQGTLGTHTLLVQFPNVAGPSFWTRLGSDASRSSCTTDSGNDCCSQNTCCPPITSTNLTQGRFEFWVYFPPENNSKTNMCHITQGSLGKTYPFYHGGKLLGVCSGKCPTGNGGGEMYNTDWTLRIMFREKGVVALLYSIPDPSTTPFSYDPVPPPLKATCCPKGNCQDFSVKDNSSDQYWFATPDETYHPYRLAEYTFNNITGLNCGVTQQAWPGGIPNPIVPLLQAGKWNFLRVYFNVPEGTAQMLHFVDKTSAPSPTQVPNYVPEDSECSLVVNTPSGSIPFTSQQGAQSFYFQPFFGGKSPDWDPACLDASCSIVSSESGCSPSFVFGDIKIYSWS